MTTPTLSPVAALRRAVCHDPHDDTVRLALADELDEHGGEIEAKWAELIRVGCEMSRWNGINTGKGGGAAGPEHLELCRREIALIRDLTPWLRRGERCDSCGGKGWDNELHSSHASDCAACHGPGWLGSLAARTARSMNARQLADAALNGGDNGYDWAIPATFTRGFVSRVELTVEQVLDAAFLARLFGEWPVTEAGLVGVHSADAIAAAGANIVSLGRAAAGLPQIGESP